MKPAGYPKNNRKTNLDRRQGQTGWLENNMLERRKSLFDRRISVQHQRYNAEDPFLTCRSLYGKGYRN